MHDSSVPILSTESAYARLCGFERDVTFRRISNADHPLIAPGATTPDTQQEYDAIMAWFETR